MKINWNLFKTSFQEKNLQQKLKSKGDFTWTDDFFVVFVKFFLVKVING